LKSIHLKQPSQSLFGTAFLCASSRNVRELAQVFPQTFISFLLVTRAHCLRDNLCPAFQAQEAHAQSRASFLRQFGAIIREQAQASACAPILA